MSPPVSLMPMARRTDGGTVPTAWDRREPHGFSAIADGAAGHVVDIRSVGQKPRLAVCARGRPRDRGDARAGPPHNDIQARGCGLRHSRDRAARRAVSICGSAVGVLNSSTPKRGILAGCCALTTSGQAAAAPPRSVMKSRRLIRSPRRRLRVACRALRGREFSRSGG